MTKLFPVEVAESAAADFDDIRTWYAEQQIPETGERVIVEIIFALRQLKQFPESGRVVPESDDKLYRELIHNPYRVVYKFDGKTVWVVRIWRSERLLDISNL